MTTRNHYHKLVRYIEEMATLPNSMISVQLLIKELKEKYPRKKAMIQELKLLEKKCNYLLCQRYLRVILSFLPKTEKNALNFNNKKKFSKKLPKRVWDKKGLPRLF